MTIKSIEAQKKQLIKKTTFIKFSFHLTTLPHYNKHLINKGVFVVRLKKQHLPHLPQETYKNMTKIIRNFI